LGEGEGEKILSFKHDHSDKTWAKSYSTDINDIATIQTKLWNALAESQPMDVIHCSKLWLEYWTCYSVPR